MSFYDKEQLYVLRNKKSGWLSSGSGRNVTPKLYTKVAAVRVAKEENRNGQHPSDGPVEVIPVTLVFGKPLED